MNAVDIDPVETGGYITADIEPERYVRVLISKNSKGYTHETTVSIRGGISLVQVREELDALLTISYEQVSAEIAQREAIEARAVTTVAGRVETAWDAPVADGEMPF